MWGLRQAHDFANQCVLCQSRAAEVDARTDSPVSYWWTKGLTTSENSASNAIKAMLGSEST